MSFVQFAFRPAARLAALLLAAVAIHAAAAERIKPGEYGKELVTVASIPLSSFTSGGEPWMGAEAKMDSNKNPYNIVVTVEGRAKADGDVSMLWATGWTSNRGTALRPAMGRPLTRVKAGEHVVVRRVGQPSQFIDDKMSSPLVSLVRADNIDIESVDVEVWSGFANPGWRDWLFSGTGALTGLIMLVLAIWFLRR
jgi:hypothetical protein